MGSRLTASGTERVYAAADMWVKRALGSTTLSLRSLSGRRRCLEKSTRDSWKTRNSGDRFLEKLERQLKGSRLRSIN